MGTLRTLFGILAALAFMSTGSAQLSRVDRGPEDWLGGAYPNIPIGANFPITSVEGSQHVQIGSLLEGETITDLANATSLTTGPAMYGGPYFRTEYIVYAPLYIRGPAVIDWTDALSFVFDRPIESFGVLISHRTTEGPATFPAGEVTAYAFNESMDLIGTISSTATSGTYDDTSTWDFFAFETADHSSSIEAITLYNVNADVAIAPGIRFEETARITASPIPEPSTYGIFGALAIGAIALSRKRPRGVTRRN